MRKVPFPARCRTYNVVEHVVAVVDLGGLHPLLSLSLSLSTPHLLRRRHARKNHRSVGALSQFLFSWSGENDDDGRTHGYSARP
jgi:hypothetical protein